MFGARIVDVTIARSASTLRIAHLRPLAAVAVAAGAEHDDQPSPRTSRAARSPFSQRLGRVRVVHQHAEALALVDRLEPAGHAPELRQRGRDRRPGHAERARSRHGAEHVLHVEQAGQRRDQLQVAVRRLAAKA